MTLQQKIKDIKSGKLTAVENVMQFGEKIEKKDKEINSFLIRNKKALDQAKEIDKRIKNKKPVGKLAGLCVAIKSCISVKELETNCASKVLENFVAPFNATVINKLIEEDAIILGMTNMDEFACGWSGETSAYGKTKNPINLEKIPGGSSSGSAAAVSADFCDFALGTDTGGSIRNPASHCNVIGLKPTYGAVSRYGLIDMTMSFDQIGPITKTPEDAELILNIIKGQDNFDTTTKSQNQKLTPKKQLTIGLVNVKDFCDNEIAEKIKQKTHKIAEKNNWKIKSINLPLDIALQTYYIIVFTEFFSATRKFDGRRFGKKIEEFAGPEVIKRILGGQEITKAEHAGKYYRSALKAREFIKKEFEKIFSNVNAIIMPTTPRTAHSFNEDITEKEMYSYDVLTCLANISGIPAISIPCGKSKKDDMPIGLQILTPHFHEDLIFKIAKEA